MSSDDARAADWAEAFAAFDEWAALDEPERADWLSALTLARPAVHARVEPLIRADVRAQGDSFLEPSARDAEAATSLAGLAGQRLGAWLIERLVGTGGMGQVWLAHRTDSRYDGQAAIKLMRCAVADAGANQRFVREGRLLGRLNHPNIARLLDAGSTDSGERYLVLEYVEGERIDTWCDRNRLGPRERVALFLSVCGAVAHAHKNLVVHRDLKPSNIFVAASGEVKLLDFGVAKLLEGETGEATELTRETGAALTPHYAAPEQLAGGPVSTATDVYGLGRVLGALLGEDVGGDLGIVVGKATRPMAAERYGTVPEFEDDLRRVLEQRPVKARPASLAYRARRYLQRHAFGVGAAALIVLALAAGFAGTLYKEREAEAQAARAIAVKQFLLDLFEQARGSMQGEGTQVREATVNDLLATGAKRIETALADQPAIRDEVFQMLIELYSDTGDPKQLADLARRRLAMARAAFGSEDARSVPAEVTMAGVLINSDEALDAAAGMLRHAEAVLDQAGDRSSLWRVRLLRWQGTLGRETSKEVPWDESPTRRAVDLLHASHPGESEELLTTLAELPGVACRAGKPEEALAAAAELQRLAIAAHGEDNLFVDEANMTRGNLYLLGGRPAEAVAPLEKALDGMRRHVGEKSPNVPIVMQILAEAYLSVGRKDDFERTFAAAREAVARDHAGDKRAAEQLAMSDRSIARIRAGKPKRCGEPR